jgi:hypothetical protein
LEIVYDVQASVPLETLNRLSTYLLGAPCKIAFAREDFPAPVSPIRTILGAP